ncbi:hypothetical protein LXL04_020704 [Taraxacum kok-saghyz]
MHNNESSRLRGLTKEVISKNLKLKQINCSKEDDKDEICVICQVGFERKEMVGVLECKHCYHVECIKEWLFHKNVCPLYSNEKVKKAHELEKQITVITVLDHEEAVEIKPVKGVPELVVGRRSSKKGTGRRSSPVSRRRRKSNEREERTRRRGRRTVGAVGMVVGAERRTRRIGGRRRGGGTGGEVAKWWWNQRENRQNPEKNGRLGQNPGFRVFKVWAGNKLG